MGLFKKGGGKEPETLIAPKDAKASKPAGSAPRPGNVKLLGIAGLVKDEEFTIEPGKTVTVGRSRECTICLRDVPRARDLDDANPIIEQHFRTVSRKHLELAYHAPNNVVLTDLSSNGSFLDGKRIEGSITITDLVQHRHELKLGTHETFALDWWELVPKSTLKMVQVKVIRQPSEDEEEEGDDAKDGKDKKDAAKKGDKKSGSSDAKAKK